MTDTLAGLIEAVTRVKASNPAALGAQTEIASLKLDSLDEVEVMMMLEDMLGIEIDQTQVNKCKTLGDLARTIEALR